MVFEIFFGEIPETSGTGRGKAELWKGKLLLIDSHNVQTSDKVVHTGPFFRSEASLKVRKNF